MTRIKTVITSIAAALAAIGASAQEVNNLELGLDSTFVEEVSIADFQEEVSIADFQTEVEVDTTKSSDFEYMVATRDRIGHMDYFDREVDGKTVRLASMPNMGMEFGVNVGADFFNGFLTPTIGGEVGYHGKNFLLMANASFGISEYNKYSEKSGQKYLLTNFGLDAGVRLFDFSSRHPHQREFWLIGSFGYKVRKNYNQYTDENYDGDLTVEVKGSTMTYGAGFRLDFKNWGKKRNFYIKGLVYTGQEYFADGSEKRFGASLSVGLNFVLGKTHMNYPALQKKYGKMSKAQYLRVLRSY